MQYGLVYLTAVIDWYSLYVLAWEASNTIESLLCVNALKHALTKGTPEIFTTDQGAQFTFAAFTEVLLGKEIAISMDGRGRALDDYPKAYSDGHVLFHGLSRYFEYYNKERKHPPLDRQTPFEVFPGSSIY